MFVSVRLLLKSALSRAPYHGRVWEKERLAVSCLVSVRAPPSSWLVDWLLELLWLSVVLNVGVKAARAARRE